MSFIVKNTTFPTVFDLLAPHSCRGCGYIGEILCKRCKNYILATKPTADLPLDGFVVGYRDELIGDLIHDLKYNSVRALARPLAEMANEILPKISGEVFLIPLPTINRHIRERGLDHTLLVAKQLAKIRDGWKLKKILRRKNNSVQVGAGKEERFEQASKAYSVCEDINKNATYILIDDVWTTGASMTEARKKLQEAGALKIVTLVLAVSRFDD